MFYVLQSTNITGASLSDCLASYPGQSLGESYTDCISAEGYSIDSADWAKSHSGFQGQSITPNNNSNKKQHQFFFSLQFGIEHLFI